jgi:nucleoside 2-deoxyribosyltransferase
MMKIVVGGSMKFRPKILDVLEDLNKIGINAVCPNTSRSDPDTDKAKNPEEKLKLAQDHYAAIKKSDGVYFICEDGYMGTSCKLELGYALACKRKIYFSQKTGDISLDCYVDKIIPTNKLNLFKREK